MKLWAPRALPMMAAVMGVPTLVAPGSVVAHVTYTLAFCVVVLSAWMAVRAESSHRLPRALMAGALTTWLAGDLLYSALTLRFGELDDISAADGFWVLGYPLLAAGLITMIRRQASGRLREAALDGLAMTTAVGALLWHFMVLPEVSGSTMSLAVIIGVFYPFGDVLLFVAGVLLVLAPGMRRGPTGYLLAALAITFFGDVVISGLSMALPEVDTERLDALLLLANSMFAAALWSRETERPAVARTDAERLHPARLVFLGVALLVLPVLTQTYVQDNMLDRAALIGATVLLTAVIFIRLFLVVRDQEQAGSALTHRATHDELTGLINRQELHARLTVALRHRRGDGPVVHFLDLNGFKAVNDRYGHAAGDFVLTEVARRVRLQMRPHDIVARLGGDEFVVVTDDPADAGGVSERLRNAVLAPMPFGGHQLTVGVSIGLASAAELSQPDSDMLLAAADDAMYREKRSRRHVGRSLGMSSGSRP
jgi:diguanylate cyclase (GGDEF)-like protein